jgi:hypothetical protein
MDKLEVSSRPGLLEKSRELGKLISASHLSKPEFRRAESSLTPIL